jgi:hypothetical protein
MTTNLESPYSPVASAEAPVPKAQRTEPLDRLARSHPAGAPTLGELAEASPRGQGAQISIEPDGTVQEAGSVAAAGSRRWLVTFLGGYRQRGRWRLGRSLRLISVLGRAELDLSQAIVDEDEVSLACLGCPRGHRAAVQRRPTRPDPLAGPVGLLLAQRPQSRCHATTRCLHDRGSTGRTVVLGVDDRQYWKCEIDARRAAP